MNVFPGLGGLPIIAKRKTRSISAENLTGAVGGGAQDVPDAGNPGSELGKGWKARPSIALQPQSPTTLAEIPGPGTITHIWITCDEAAYRSCVLRMFWDGQEQPSVECTVGDFFANGHGVRCNQVNSLPVAVNPNGGMNCYWPMPFRRHARVEIVNESAEPIPAFFFQIDYELGTVMDGSGYFHAQWRRAVTDRANPEYVVLDGVQGSGQYVGTFVAWTQLSDGWWGEGEFKFFIDGDEPDCPTICGTGTEDYFGGAWCFGDTYSTAFLGYPFWEKDEGCVPKHGLYRWHVLDPIRFGHDLRVSVQALGWWPHGKYQPLADDISSVAYWYQTLPTAPFPLMPGLIERLPR